MKSWCKVASNLDSHPKIRKAGRYGREVFLFALRRNAEPDNPVPGRLPAAILEPWFIADQLMMPESEAVTGVTACVTAGLLLQDGESWLIDGWDDDWGKRPLSVGERVSKHRESKKKSDLVTSGNANAVTDRSSNGCNALDQTRSEEKESDSPSLAVLKAKVDQATGDIGKRRSQRAPKPSVVFQPAVDAFDMYFRAANGGTKPLWDGTTIGMIKTLCGKSPCDEVVRRIEWLQSHPPKWPPSPWDLKTFIANYDKCIPAQPVLAWQAPIA